MKIILQWFKEHPRGVLQINQTDNGLFCAELIDIINGEAKILVSSTMNDPQSTIIQLEIELRPPSVKPPKRY
jgi:hypothetical protein